MDHMAGANGVSTDVLESILARRSGPPRIDGPAMTPWGNLVTNLSVSDFVRDYRTHLPLVFARRRSMGLEPSARLQLLTEAVVALYASLLVRERDRTARDWVGLRFVLAQASRQKWIEEEGHPESGDEELSPTPSDASEAVLEFLLSLMGL
jgi:hypothetical protein